MTNTATVILTPNDVKGQPNFGTVTGIIPKSNDQICLGNSLFGIIQNVTLRKYF